MARPGSARIEPKLLTEAQVARKLKARGLKATPDEIEQLTRMMNEDLALKAEERRRELGRRETEAANARFFKAFWGPVLAEQRAAKTGKRKR